jgi:outer membrane protein assembly factor BamB
LKIRYQATLVLDWHVGTIVMLLFWTLNAAAEDWYRWRGPNLNGISSERDWLDKWPVEGPNINWKASVGTGFSSVSVSKDRLYTIGNEENTDTVYCLDTSTGKHIWKHSYACPLDDRFFEGGPTSTPTIDGENLFTLSRQGDLFCLNATTGMIQWARNIVKQDGMPVPGWGFGASPLVHEQLLVLNAGEGGIALEKSSGKLVWKSDSREAGYATPLPVRSSDATILIFASRRFYMGVDVGTGEKLWRHRWLTQFGCNAADPIAQGRHVFISSGYGRGSALLNIEGDKPTVVWKSKEMQNQLHSSVLIDGSLYGFDGAAGIPARLTCMEYLTGKIQWTDQWPGVGSLSAADGKLIILSEQGELVIATASATAFLPVARAQILTGKCWTVPVLSDGRIYCRNAAGDVACVDVRSPKE